MAYSIAEEFKSLLELFIKQNIVYTMNIFQHSATNSLHFHIKRKIKQY